MTPDEKEAHAWSFPVHVGVDTGKSFHVLVARGPDRKRRKPFKVLVSREGFDAADEYLTGLFPEVPRERMLVGVEFAGHHGQTFAADLARRGYPLVSVLPAVTKKHKEDQDNSPLKNDEKDAGVICKLIGEGKFVTLTLLETPFAEMRVLAMHRHRLSVEGVRFKNRIKGALDVAWPEFAGAFATLDAPTPLEILRRWPLPSDLVAAPAEEVSRVIRTVSRGHYRAEKVEALIAGAESSVALTLASDERRREIQGLLERWALLRAQMAEVDARIEALVADYPPARALTTIPELGPVGAATILSELGALDDYVHPRQVLKLAGMNLVASDSALRRGRRKQSKRGRPLLRKQLYLLATRWCKSRGLYRSEYMTMLARNGGSKTKAICALARKLVPLILEVAQSERAFDEARWRAERRIRAA